MRNFNFWLKIFILFFLLLSYQYINTSIIFGNGEEHHKSVQKTGEGVYIPAEGGQAQTISPNNISQQEMEERTSVSAPLSHSSQSEEINKVKTRHIKILVVGISICIILVIANYVSTRKIRQSR